MNARLIIAVAAAFLVGCVLLAKTASPDPDKLLAKVRDGIATDAEFRDLYEGKVGFGARRTEVVSLCRDGLLRTSYAVVLAECLSRSQHAHYEQDAEACEALLGITDLPPSARERVLPLLIRHKGDLYWARAAMCWLESGKLTASEESALLDAYVPNVDVQIGTPDGRCLRNDIAKIELISDVQRWFPGRVTVTCEGAELRTRGRAPLDSRTPFDASPAGWLRVPDRPGETELKFTLRFELGLPYLGVVHGRPLPPSIKGTAIKSRAVVLEKTIDVEDLAAERRVAVSGLPASARLEKWVWPSRSDAKTADGPADSESVWVKASITPTAGWLIWRSQQKEIARGWIVIETPPASPGFSRFTTSMSSPLTASQVAEIWFEPDAEWFATCRFFDRVYTGPAWQVFRRPDARWPVPADEW